MKVAIKQKNSELVALNVETDYDFFTQTLGSTKYSMITSPFLSPDIVLIVEPDYLEHKDTNNIGVGGNIVFMKFDMDIKEFVDMSDVDVQDIALALAGEGFTFRSFNRRGWARNG